MDCSNLSIVDEERQIMTSEVKTLNIIDFGISALRGEHGKENQSFLIEALGCILGGDIRKTSSIIRWTKVTRKNMEGVADWLDEGKTYITQSTMFDDKIAIQLVSVVKNENGCRLISQGTSASQVIQIGGIDYISEFKPVGERQ